MDNFIPAIIIIGGIIYKIYNEFQKEQEAARKRQSTMPKRPIPVPTSVETIPTTPKLPVNPPSIPPVQQSVPTEVLMARKRKEEKRTQLKKPMEVIELDEKPAFNLREAVIQSAILERPYSN
ncbi:hypothetical protein ORI89_18115 [Sphingobacterium sp. UT-1RO-CII-1]|nr:hypothetical protein [Sphingobacterium sp. UT-1RO-CII-1]